MLQRRKARRNGTVEPPDSAKLKCHASIMRKRSKAEGTHSHNDRLRNKSFACPLELHLATFTAQGLAARALVPYCTGIALAHDGGT